MTMELKAPVDIQIELTQECNQSCNHCYNYWKSYESGKNTKKHLSLDNISHIVGELTSNQVPSITITGGEPFVRKKELFAFLDATRDLGIRTSINSNFSLVEPGDISILSRKHPNVSILISILSSDSAVHENLTNSPKGTHARVIQNAKLAVNSGLPISINMVLLRQNIADMRDLAKISKDIGVRTFCATKVLPTFSTKEKRLLLPSAEVLRFLSELINIEKDFKINVDTLECYPKCLLFGTESFKKFSHRVCVAGKTTVTIGADGEVRPCSHVMVSYGNIFRESLSSIWKKMAGWRNGEFLPDKCKNCAIIAFCTGGCRMNTLTSNLNDMDFYAQPNRLPNLPKEQLLPKTIDIDNSNQFLDAVIISPNVKIREESFGAVICQPDPWGIILVNKSTANFLKANMGIIFKFEDFIKSSGASNEEEQRGVKHLYLRLIQKRILITPV